MPTPNYAMMCSKPCNPGEFCPCLGERIDLGGPDRVHLTEEGATELHERFEAYLIGHSQMSGYNPNRRQRIAIWFAIRRDRIADAWAVLLGKAEAYRDYD